MIAFNDNCIRLSRGVVVFRCGAGEISEGQIGLAVAETVVKEGNFLSVQRTGSPQPIQHLGTDVLIRRVCTEGKNRKCCRFERRIETCLG